MSKASWMAYTSANWLDSPSPSAVSVTCVGLHAAVFHLCYFPTMQQEPPVNRAYCFLSSGSWLYSGASSVRVTSSSGNAFFAFWPVHDYLQNSWATGVSHSDALCDQRDPLTPRSIGGMMCRGDPLFEHPAQDRQSWS